jgi:regulator of replication initiation timing
MSSKTTPARRNVTVDGPVSDAILPTSSGREETPGSAARMGGPVRQHDRARFGLLGAALLFSFALAVCAAEGPDEITLQDGAVLQGQVVKEDAEGVTLKLKFGQTTYKHSEVKSLRRGAAPAAHAGDLRDVLTLRSGAPQEGLLVSADDREVVFDVITGGANVSKPLVLRTRFVRDEVKQIKELTPEQRKDARAYLAGLETQTKQDAVTEAKITIEPHEWKNKDPNLPPIAAGMVKVEHFRIESNAPEAFFRKCAFRLAKVYRAYQDHLGAERNTGEKVRVVLFRSLEQYYASINNVVRNPAIYVPSENLVAAGCEVAAFERATAVIKTEFDRLNTLIAERRKVLEDARASIVRQMAKYYEMVKKAPNSPAAKAFWEQLRQEQTAVQLQMMKYQNELDEFEKSMSRFQAQFDAEFDKHTGQMLRMLYHEGFHAFLRNFLFEEKAAQKAPVWLNEGLAQYFEQARVEGSRLVLGQLDREWMAMLREWNKEGGLVPVADLVSAGSDKFLVKSDKDQAASTKHYLQSWAVIHWLGEQGRLNKKNLEAYVNAVASGKPSPEALPLLTGVSNEKLQEALREKLKYDFSVKEGAGK